jgi:hypothetical protein
MINEIEEDDVRFFIALAHEDGKCHIYGDDGEIQCSNIARHGRTIDFKRESIKDILNIISETRMMEYLRSLEINK